MERTLWTDERLDDAMERIDKRFDAVDRRFDAVDRRFDAVDRRLDAVDRRLDGLQHEMHAGFAAIQRQMVQIVVALSVGYLGLIAAVLARG